MNCNDPDTTEKSYMDVIYFKTAKLFEAATQLVAVLGEQPEAISKRHCSTTESILVQHSSLPMT